jgi:VCBS repeat-containing protein
VGCALDGGYEMSFTDFTAGPETIVNTTTASDQFYPSVAALNTGGYVVTWMSYNAGDQGYDIYGQTFDASGAAIGAETRINSTSVSEQSPSVAGLSNGGYVVTWMSYGQDGDGWGIYGQRYDASGTAVGGETQINTTTVSDQIDPSVAALNNGGYIVTWASSDPTTGNFDVYGQRYDASGNAVGGETLIDTPTGSDQLNPKVAGLSDGGYVVTWEALDPVTSNYGLFEQRYDASGKAVGGETQIDIPTGYDHCNQTVTGLKGGGWVVAWMSFDGSDYNVFEQRYDASGAASGGEIRVNTTTANIQGYPSIAALSDGGYEVTWSSLAQDGSGWGVYGQRYDASGNAVGSETLINSTTANDQMYPSVAGLTGGGDAVAWMSSVQDGSGWGVYDKVYSPSTGPSGASGPSDPPAPLPPVVVAENASATEAGGVNNTTPGVNPTGNVLTHDTDPNGDALMVSAVSHGVTTGVVGSALVGDHGTLTLNPDGSYTYVVNNNDGAVQALASASDTLTDTFSYTVSDTSGATSSTTLTVTIQGANDAPVAVADTASATEAGGVNNGAPGVNPTGNVLTNDTDVDLGDTKTVSAVSHGAISGAVGSGLVGDHGTLTLNADGSYTYVVNNSDSAVQALASASDTLTDTFSYTVQDSAGATSSTTLTVTIHGANDAPVALADQNVVAKGASLSVAASGGVLANDSDVDLGNHLSVSQVNGSASSVGHALNGAYGVLTLNADGSYSYAANSNASGSGSLQDVFTYQVSDGHGGVATSTLTVSVIAKGTVYIQGAASGSDTLVGGNKASVLVAGGGADVMSGGNGSDTLIAGTGSDTMTGGNGPDLFVFNQVVGHDVITDFSPHVDTVQFSHAIFSSYSQMMSHAAQVGSDVVITIDAADTVTLQHLTLSSLSSSDFLFV